MYRFTNAVYTDATHALPLARASPAEDFPVLPEAASALRAAGGNPELAKAALAMLQNADVAYLKSRQAHPMNAPIGKGLHSALLELDPSIFSVTVADDPPKPTSRPKPKSKDVRKAPESVSDPVAMEVSTKAQRQAKRARPAEELEPLSASASKAMEVFEELLEETFDQCDVIVGHGAGEVPSEGAREGKLTVARLARLNTQMEQLNKLNLLHTLKVETALRLLALLDEHLKPGATTELTEQDTEKSEEFQNVLVTVDASLAVLLLMTAPDMNKKVHREETIDQVVELVRFHTSHNVFVAYDPMFYQLYRGDKEEDDEGKRKKKGGVRSATLQATNSIKTLSGRLTRLYRELSLLSTRVRIQDSTMLSLCNTAMASLQVEDIQHLQLGALSVITAVFTQHPTHRTMVLDELLGILLKIPVTGRKLRMFSLVGEEQASVQMVCAALLHCIQGCVQLPDVATVLADAEMQSNAATESYRVATLWTSYFWQELLKRFASAKTQEIRFQDLLANLVTDVLAVHNQPEWPAAHLLLQGLCLQLVGPYGLQSSLAVVRTMATDVLGKVLAKMRKDAADADEDAASDAWQAAFNSTADMDSVAAAAPHAHTQDEIFAALLTQARHEIRRARLGFQQSSSEPENEEVMLMRQGLLQYLSGMRARQTDDGAAVAQRYLLCEWARDDAGTVHLATHSLRLAEAQRQHGSLSQVHLSHDNAVRVSRWLVHQRSQTKQHYDALLKRLLSMLEDSASHVREKVIRSVGIVLETDVALLGDENVQAAVERRLSDGAISVRRAAVELLGKYISIQPALAVRYYGAISERITDVGVSVRKCVVGILRECLAMPSFTKKQEALVRIMLRIRDDEESIQQLVVDTFQEQWFSGASADNDARAQQLVTVVYTVYSNLKSHGQVALPLASNFPPVDLFTRLLQTHNRYAVIASAQRVCFALLEGILRAKEQPGAAAHADAPPAVQLVLKQSPALAYGLALHALCVAEPDLCVPEDNPMRFLRTLQPYLELSSTTKEQKVEAEEAQQLQCMLAVIDAVLSLLKAVPSTLASALKDNLEDIVKRHPYHGVLFFAARCLCTLASTCDDARTTTLSLLYRFVSLIEVCHKKMGEQKRRMHAQRALFVVGQLCRFGSHVIDASPRASSDKDPVRVSTILQLFLRYLEPNMDLETKTSALQACGFVLIAQPRLVLSEPRIDSAMMESLQPTAPQCLKEQALMNLCDMVKEEENLMVASQQEAAKLNVENAKAEADAKGKYIVPKINGMGDNCLSGGIVQRYWDPILALATHESKNTPKLRLKVLQLSEAVLRHGLVHPMSCIAMLIAMQGDSEKAIQRMATRLLHQVHTQHASFVTDRLINGVQLAFDFQRTVCKASHKPGAEDSVAEQAGVSESGREGMNQTYQLFKAARSLRNRFLQVLMRRFEDGKIDREGLPFLCFCADLLANLNYSTLEEPLFVVYTLNRIISVRGATLVKQLKRRFAKGKDVSTAPATVDDEGAVAKEKDSSSDEEIEEKQEAREKLVEADAEDTTKCKDPKGGKAKAAAINSAVALAAMLLLKRHLRAAYALTDQRVQAFNPQEQPQKEAATRLSEDAFDMTCLDLGASSSEHRSEKLYKIFRKLMSEDSNDFATEYKAVGRKKASTKGAGKRGRPRKSDPVQEDDEMDEDGV